MIKDFFNPQVVQHEKKDDREIITFATFIPYGIIKHHMRLWNGTGGVALVTRKEFSARATNTIERPKETDRPARLEHIHMITDELLGVIKSFDVIEKSLKS